MMSVQRIASASRAALAAMLVAGGACKRPGPAPEGAGSAGPQARAASSIAEAPAPRATDAAAATDAATDAAAAASAASDAAAATDASAGGSATQAPATARPPGSSAECKTAVSTVLGRVGPASLVFTEGEPAPVALFNVGGAPAPEARPVPPRSAPTLLPSAGPPGPLGGGSPVPGPLGAASPVTAPTETPRERASRSACATTAAFSYCMDDSGAVRRRRSPAEPGAVVAHALPGTPLSAIDLEGGRSAVAFLSPRKTSEGLVSVAFVVVDGQPPIPISEDGAGATFVALAPRGGGRALAVSVDARVALSPVHARPLTFAAKPLPEPVAVELGRDAVVLVAAGGDRAQRVAMATSSTGVAHLLVPTTMEGGGFGVASTRIEGDPADDMPLVWWRSPGALSGAAIAATQGVDPARVALVRPGDGKQVLELGTIGADGRFEPRCIAAEATSITQVNVAAAEGGASWLVYTTPEGTRLELRSPRVP